MALKHVDARANPTARNILWHLAAGLRVPFLDGK